jgi:3-(methylthio)propanoyl-CoA dehydrogenase
MSYKAPLKDMLFNLQHVSKIDELTTLEVFKEYGLETAQMVLEECAKFNESVLVPLNASADKAPAVLANQEVKTSAGFKDAYAQYIQGGWQGLQHPLDFGGQNLPKSIGALCSEILNSANMSFALCPLLTDGAIEALLTAGSEEQKQTYLHRLVSGEWSGTMNLTEPQAGSDLSLIRTRAEPSEQGEYKIFGTKIYITYGEHDMSKNIVHMVLARVNGAPEGVKGISLFLVPKFMPLENGELGERNDVYCVSLEHKLGIKASPTAVMQFGDHGGARAFLVGEENRGLEYMFIMMNAARYGVGIQGVALAERAYQKAVSYALERVQSRPVDGSQKSAVAIAHHPDVKRMLMTMRAYTQGCRSLASFAAGAFDRAHHATDPGERQAQLALYEFLVPLVKGFSTEMSQWVSSIGVQVHGGMGFIEETGAAQFYRDAKILTIYEGTTAIQANDLLGRKTIRDGGRFAARLSAMMGETLREMTLHQEDEDLKAMSSQLSASKAHFDQAVEFMLLEGQHAPNSVYAGSVPFLTLTSLVVVAWLFAKSMMVSRELMALHPDERFYLTKLKTARFFADHILPQTQVALQSIVHGSSSVNAFSVEDF